LGGSGFSGQGRYDLGSRAGELHLRDLRLLPRDVAVLSRSASAPMSGEIRGQADATLNGEAVSVAARLQAGGGYLQIDARAALGLRVSAQGTASYDAVALDVDVQAPDLQVVGRGVGALRKQPSLPLSGSAHLAAHLTGSPRSPDAQVHLRAPSARLGQQFAAT